MNLRRRRLRQDRAERAGSVDLSKNISVENVDEIKFRNTSGAQKKLTLVIGNDEIDGAREMFDVIFNFDTSFGSSNTVSFIMTIPPAIDLSRMTFLNTNSLTTILIVGDQNNNTITGGDAADIICAVGGSDIIYGRDGGDTV